MIRPWVEIAECRSTSPATSVQLGKPFANTGAANGAAPTSLAVLQFADVAGGRLGHGLRRDIRAEEIEEPDLGRHQIGEGGMRHQVEFRIVTILAIVDPIRLRRL